MNELKPHFTITNVVTRDLTVIERARGFLQAATLSDDWVLQMSQRALLLEAYHTTHIEGTQLTLESRNSFLPATQSRGRLTTMCESY